MFKKRIILSTVIAGMLCLLGPEAFSATRFYYQTSLEAHASPALTTGWQAATATLDKKRMLTTRTGNGVEQKLESSSAGNGKLDATRQYVSDPILAQTISGTVKGQLRAYDDKASLMAVGIQVVSNDGTTQRGILLAPNSYGTAFTTSARNTYAPSSVALTSVTAQNGDRIVVEIGIKKTAGGTATVYHFFGDGSGTDLPENETETAAYNPWIEFSQDINFMITRSGIIN